MPNSKDIGDETEARAISALVGNGYGVAVPFGDNDEYDLVVDDGERLSRVQCKTAWQHKTDAIRFNKHSQTTTNGEYEERSYDGAIDAFLVRYPATNALYWVPIEDAPGRKMELRFESEIDHPAINWADEYRFDGEPPRE